MGPADPEADCPYRSMLLYQRFLCLHWGTTTLGAATRNVSLWGHHLTRRVSALGCFLPENMLVIEEVSHSLQVALPSHLGGGSCCAHPSSQPALCYILPTDCSHLRWSLRLPEAAPIILRSKQVTRSWEQSHLPPGGEGLSPPPPLSFLSLPPSPHASLPGTPPSGAYMTEGWDSMLPVCPELLFAKRLQRFLCEPASV